MRTYSVQGAGRFRRFRHLAPLVACWNCAAGGGMDAPAPPGGAPSSEIVEAVGPVSPGDTAGLERQLSRMEDELRANPGATALASRYRARCAESGRHDRSIKFFEDLVAVTSGNERARIELASAYIDKIPTCTGLTAFVRRGALARKSLQQLDPVIADNRNSWLAYFCRGMNHLYWPRLLGHASDAVADFRRCIELQQPDTPGSLKPYHVRSYIGLGDAYTKAKQYERARRAWREGLRRFPQSQELKRRLDVAGDSALLKFVEARRSLDKPVDTDLTFLDASASTTDGM